MTTPLASVSETPQSAFARHHEAWLSAHIRLGAARAYPFAWRLLELARPAGRSAVSRAQLALALTLYELGRFAEAQSGLPMPDAITLTEPLAATLLALHVRCLCVRGHTEAGFGLAQQIWRHAPASLASLEQRAYLHFLMDDAAKALPVCATYLAAARATPSRTDAHWATVLDYWARARLGLPPHETAMHLALSALRASVPARAAHAEAIHAEAIYHRNPRWAPVWLDAALERCERFGQHHLKARLLNLKAQALEAAGQLVEAGRFDKLARNLAQHQGAGLYLPNLAR